MIQHPGGQQTRDAGMREASIKSSPHTLLSPAGWHGCQFPLVRPHTMRSGAGKTTTVGMLTTRVVPTSGRAFLGAVDVAAHPALAKQLSGMVSQQNTLDRQLTVWENLYFHGRLFGIGAKASRQIADELLARWPDDPAYHSLHGGSRQALRPGRRYGPRQDPRPGHPGCSEAVHRRRHHRLCEDERRHRQARRSARGGGGRGDADASGGGQARNARAGRRAAGPADRAGGRAQRIRAG
jgi:ABC-type Fe3+/spermidine/putrescine transport system ATPase subunit